ncbi:MULTISPECIES: extracellular solute-binding protein [Thiorhodovibrio]|uniref:extracellular solute-binding protein n=1 Tax=Thiorhodovibrio TaxID=61593 RepID=UPI001914336D|nr:MULTISPECIES: extracellular solute-binding protein [Thiorhodovibrio]MBK5970378.1 VWA domain-containing protein [Thiorhodovibrio winogradskyi]WPL14317.1 von Willebrand factor type A domain protein [Thiorhodovibrio litoralis]
MRYSTPLSFAALLLALCLPSLVTAKQANTCTPADDQVVVRFTYGSEKAAWIHEATEAFNAEGVKTASGKPICVNAIPKGSGDSVNEIMNGGSGPEEVHATSPASDLYVNLINHESTEAGAGELLGIDGFLVSSPVVIAAWEPVVERLGGADAVGWKSLFEQAGADAIRYGQTNPERSNSGLSALVAQFFAGAEVASGNPVARLSMSAVDDPKVREFVEKVHEHVIHYGASTGFYAKKMTQGGPQYADAAVLYESDVIQANNSIRQDQLGYPRLVAVYPREGTFVSNHPFAIVKRDWVDADEQEGAKRYFEYLMSPPVQAQALQYGFRPGVALDIDQGIYDKVWNAENGVQPFDTVHRFLAAPSGAVVQAVRDAFRGIKNEAIAYLIIDRSGSMDAKIRDAERGTMRSRMEMAVESAELLANRMQDQDRLALLFYDYAVAYSDLTPKGQPIAMDAAGKQKLAETLGRARPKGGTAMRGAIAEAWEDICADQKAHADQSAIRVIVVLTDGKDNAYKITTDELIEKIGYSQADGQGGYFGDPQCRIPVFGVAFGEKADDRELTAITESAGGETRRGDSGEIRAIFQRFSDLL